VGIFDFIARNVASVLGDFLPTDVATSIGTVAAPALVGAATGAAGSAIARKPIGKGVLEGFLGGAGAGLTGPGGPLQSELTDLTGFTSPGWTSAVGGALGAGAGAALTGGNPLAAALYGGIGGYGYGSLAGPSAAAPTMGSAAGAGAIDRPWDPGYSAPAYGSTAAMMGAPGSPISTAGAVTGTSTPIDQFGNPVSTVAANVATADAARTAGGTTAGGTTAGGTKTGELSKQALLLGGLGALGSLFSKPKIGTWPTPGPSSVAANAGPYYNMGLPPAGTFPGRTPLTPAAQTYYTYGQPPPSSAEQLYFSGNQLTNYGWGAPAAAHGGSMRRSGFDTRQRDRYVRGPGSSTSDSIPARLSDGEYVLDAKDVTRIGGGSNVRGAKVLDRVRKHLDRGGGPLARLHQEAA
jgi:hypothetical protein